MSRGKKFTFPRRIFHRFCDFPKCDEKVVRCTAVLEDGKVCGCFGHPDYYKQDEEHLVMVVKHAHFLMDKDKGRNVFHLIKTIIAPKDIRVPTWKTYRGAERWKKIPYEVRHNMGWD